MVASVRMVGAEEADPDPNVESLEDHPNADLPIDADTKAALLKYGAAFESVVSAARDWEKSQPVTP